MVNNQIQNCNETLYNFTYNKSFIDILKQNTDIDIDFIETFFENFRIGGELDFNIKDTVAAKYLGVSLTTIRKRLSNYNAKTKQFHENVDFIKIKGPITSTIIYQLNYQCFERLAMSGDSNKSEQVRSYFIKLREFLVDNQNAINQSMQNVNSLKKFNHFETMYFFVANDKVDNSIIKTGSALGIISRLRGYNTGRIPDVELKYFAVVKNRKLIEQCLKSKLKNNRVYSGRELFRVDPEILKTTIEKCYAKYVSKNEDEELYMELAELYGIYAYTKNKQHMKPYVIIGNKLL